uniref:MADF domain-containing protein n=1 Tax=Anopheles farauti TaxID=69004 RepID=A0A182QJE8_9DIPT
MSSEWQREATEFLIQEYQKHPVLYDMRHPRYYNKTSRSKALSEMVMEINTNVRPGTSMKDVLRKIQTMRTQFGQELSKARRHSANGTVYQPTVWWYHGLSFLKQHIKHRSVDATSMTKSESESWKHESEDNNSFNVAYVRNGENSQSSNDFNPDYEHSNDDMEYETEVHYEINPIDMKSIKALELKPIPPNASVGSNKRETRHSDHGERKVTRSSQATFSTEQPYVTRASTSNDLNAEQGTATVLELKTLDATSTETITPIRTIATVATEERHRSLGSFVAAQMASIRDDYTFYETQMEILNIVNKGILRQLSVDKESTTVADEGDRDKRKNNDRNK